MMDDFSEEFNGRELTEFQELIMQYWTRQNKGRKLRMVSQNEIARRLGVSPSNLSTWINGQRIPDFTNAVTLSDPARLGPRVLEILGYPYVVEVRDQNLRYVIENWGVIDDETRQRIYQAVTGERPIE
jgi:transcriptional regulator with XRE-family HTH domain